MRRNWLAAGLSVAAIVGGMVALARADGPAPKSVATAPTTGPTLSGGSTLGNGKYAPPTAGEPKKPTLVAPDSGAGAGSGGGPATIQVGGGVNVGQSPNQPDNRPPAEGHATVRPANPPATPPTTAPAK